MNNQPDYDAAAKRQIDALCDQNAELKHEVWRLQYQLSDACEKNKGLSERIRERDFACMTLKEQLAELKQSPPPQPPRPTLADLQQRIHANSVKQGKWKMERSWPEIRMGIVEKIAHALFHWRAQGREVTAFPVALADVAIEIMDYAYCQDVMAGGLKGPAFGSPTADMSIGECIDWIISPLYDEPVNVYCSITLAMHRCFAIAKHHDIDLIAAIELKHSYNCTLSNETGGQGV